MRAFLEYHNSNWVKSSIARMGHWVSTPSLRINLLFPIPNFKWVSWFFFLISIPLLFCEINTTNNSDFKFRFSKFPYSKSKCAIIFIGWNCQGLTFEIWVSPTIKLILQSSSWIKPFVLWKHKLSHSYHEYICRTYISL